jgi:hypothetical protein
MIKTSKKSIFKDLKDQCNHIVDLYLSAKIVVSKGKLPLPTISYTLPIFIASCFYLPPYFLFKF